MKRIKILLSKKQRFYLLLIFIGAFLVSAVETVGLGSIAGFVMILSDPETFIIKVPNETIRSYLINKEFFIGNAKVKGIELCEPCLHLQTILRQKNLVKKLVHKAGLRCEILASGKISVGDIIK